jgi:hypothetical protein
VILYRHRAEREAKVLDAILGGARTAYEVVAEAYKDTPAAFWPAALKNVKLHVEHLDYLHKLPPVSSHLPLAPCLAV